MDRTKQPGLQISQIVLLHASFRHRADALALPPDTKIGNLPVLLEGRYGVESDGRNAIIHLRAYTPPDDATLLYAFDVEIGMLVTAIPGEENLAPSEYAVQMGPVTAYPFLREAVAGITMRGRFGALWLRPLNLLASEQSAEKGMLEAETTATAEA